MQAIEGAAKRGKNARKIFDYTCGSLTAAHAMSRNGGRDAMNQPRREFLFSGGVVFSGVMCSIQLTASGQSRKMPNPPPPAETNPTMSGTTGNRVPERAILQQHEKEFRESLATLFKRVNELKAEVEELHSADIFSIKIYKQTSEIEHLAKQLKNLARN